MVKQKTIKEKVPNKAYYEWTYGNVPNFPREELCKILAQRTNMALEDLSSTRKYKYLCRALDCTGIKLEFRIPTAINSVHCFITLITPHGPKPTNTGMEVYTGINCIEIIPLNRGKGVKLFPDNIHKMLEVVLLGRPWD